MTRVGDWIDDLAEEHGMEAISLEERQAWERNGHDSTALGLGDTLPGSLTETAYLLPEGLTFDGWQAAGRYLQRAHRAVQWWVGDWLLYGERRYGEMYAQAIEETTYAYKSLRNAVFVAGRFEVSRRRDNLPFTHHAEVAGLGVEEADALLDASEAKRWSSRDLRAAVKAFKRERQRQVAAALPAPDPASIPETVCIEQADARSLPLEDDVVDLIVTSPPYALDVAYEDGDVAAEDWPIFMHDWLVEALRVTKPSGRLALNVPLDTTLGGSRPTYAQAVMAALDAGWSYQATIVWHESNTTTGNRGLGSVSSSARPHPVDSSEMIALFSKGEWGPSSGNPDDIEPDEWQEFARGPWSFSGESRAWEGHPAPFPKALPYRLIKLLSRRGDLVCDPFAGSGTTATVAHEGSRRFVGFDISEAYVRSSLRRLVG
jgi:site-specific DNA-methyltransferase (adenine-specific)